jgi:protein-disulfide isomerase
MSNRSRTRDRRVERGRRQRRQRQIYALIAVVVVVVVVVGLIIVSNVPADAPIPPSSEQTYANVPQSKSEKGYPRLGNTKAPVRVDEYSSFDCTHCADFHETVTPALVARAGKGEILFAYVPLYGTGSISNGQGAARAALCVGEQGKFWQYHDALFTWQKTFGQGAFSQSRLVAGLDNLGINRSAFDQCMGSDLPDKVLQTAITDTQALGASFSGTPTVAVNGVVVGTPGLNEINQAIDQALSLAGVTPIPVQPTQPVTGEATPEATAAH